jgi:hypothetical protein
MVGPSTWPHESRAQKLDVIGRSEIPKELWSHGVHLVFPLVSNVSASYLHPAADSVVCSLILASGQDQRKQFNFSNPLLTHL